jgi:hypothetical protein
MVWLPESTGEEDHEHTYVSKTLLITYKRNLLFKIPGRVNDLHLNVQTQGISDFPSVMP